MGINSIGIIGYGRFGKLMSDIILKASSRIKVKVFSSSHIVDQTLFFELSEVCKCDVIIPSVPISAFDEVINRISHLIPNGGTVLDVCSVKVHPRDVMLKYLPAGINIIATHPMFGPGNFNPDDYSSTVGKLAGLNFVIDRVRCDDNIYEEIIKFVKKLGLNIHEMSSNDHDQIAAKYQFITLLSVFTLKSLNMANSPIDTRSAKMLKEVVSVVTIDQKLFLDIYKYNPYCRNEFLRYMDSFENIKNLLFNQK